MLNMSQFHCHENSFLTILPSFVTDCDDRGWKDFCFENSEYNAFRYIPARSLNRYFSIGIPPWNGWPIIIQGAVVRNNTFREAIIGGTQIHLYLRKTCFFQETSNAFKGIRPIDIGSSQLWQGNPVGHFSGEYAGKQGVWMGVLDTHEHFEIKTIFNS